MKSYHLWLLYLGCPIVKPLNGWYYFEFSLEVAYPPGSPIEEYVKSSGVFLEFKEGGRLNWAIEGRSLSCTHFPEVMYEEDSDQSEDSEGSSLENSPKRLNF